MLQKDTINFRIKFCVFNQDLDNTTTTSLHKNNNTDFAAENLSCQMGGPVKFQIKLLLSVYYMGKQTTLKETANLNINRYSKEIKDKEIILLSSILF